MRRISLCIGSVMELFGDEVVEGGDDEVLELGVGEEGRTAVRKRSVRDWNRPAHVRVGRAVWIWAGRC